MNSNYRFFSAVSSKTGAILSHGSNEYVIVCCEFCLNEFETSPKNINSRSDKSIVCISCIGTRNAYVKSGIKSDKYEFWKSRRFSVEHILVHETLEKYGYSSINFHSRVATPVLCKCEFCHTSFETALVNLSSNKHVRCKDCMQCCVEYSRTGSMVPKHEFWISYRESIVKRLRLVADRISVPIINIRSDKLLNVVCDFCQKPFLKRTKYIDYHHGRLVCSRCASLASSHLRFASKMEPHEYFLKKRPILCPDRLFINETIDEFGYDPTSPDRPPNSKLIVKCCFCDSPVRTKYSYFVKKNLRVTCIKCRRRKASETLISKYGVSSPLELPSMSDPLTERIVASILKDRYNVSFVRNYSIPITDSASYIFDFFIPSCNLLIECQGDYFHDFKSNGYSGTPRDQAKASWIENCTNMKLVHIWEHEIHAGRVAKILSRHIGGSITPEVTVSSNKLLSFAPISNQDAHVFLSIHHYLGNLGSVATCYGAFLEDKLLCVAAFGGTTRYDTFRKVNRIFNSSFGTKELKELRRFCILPNVKAKRMASFCLREFIKMYKNDHPSTSALVGFSDPTVGDSGSIYQYSGWESIQKTVKSYHYLDPVTMKMIHKKTVWDLARDAHMTERDFAEKSRLHKVGELSKHVWIKIF